MMKIKSYPTSQIGGLLTIPGDKSISHRAAILAACASGPTQIAGFLESEDTLATCDALRLLGVTIQHHANSQLDIAGVGLGHFQSPAAPMDLKNSGTGIRLLTGLLAGQGVRATLVGDPSLNKRPMQRVVEPLRLMGANIQLTSAGTAPIDIYPVTGLRSIHYELPVASGQLKSALLLAALSTNEMLELTEQAITRDHTERMLPLFGAHIDCVGRHLQFLAPPKLLGTSIKVPGDLSSAAFFIVAALLAKESQLKLEGVGVNPTRIGVIDLLKKMGARIELTNFRQYGQEPVADLVVASSSLQGIDIPIESVSLAIDEFPILMIAAACAQGTTQINGAGELRVKETDRIAAMARGLTTLGIDVEEYPEGIRIEGGVFRGGIVDSEGDHRIAMAFAIAGMRALEPVTILNCANIATSFRQFVPSAQRVGLNMEIL